MTVLYPPSVLKCPSLIEVGENDCLDTSVAMGAAQATAEAPASEEPSLALDPALLPDFDELVQRYQRQVLVIAYRILGNWQDAEDLAQEALLKAYLRLGDLVNPASLGAWLRRLTVNACLDALARQQRRPATVSLTASEDHEAPVPERFLAVASAEEAAVRAEEWRDLRATLLRLEPGAREALVLREIYGYSYAEIAGMLDLGLSAVKMRVHRARHAVQRALNE
ncbi:MAG: RNA polymerase sigma factor [Oscillochloridaceae bacterium]|nr:RNA polymerase sigma factor [Chloroflexaceae bacterium]MDW8391033.1 RNA polymerase sigma factor [Oscillochloridaceae bacterium]